MKYSPRSAPLAATKISVRTINDKTTRIVLGLRALTSIL
jgi:hypothetical protein